jgi:predicted PurR-regulated permease PerM
MVSSADALLSLLGPAWQALVAGCLAVVTVLGVRRLTARGRSRMTNAVLLTGILVIGLAVLSLLAVSCSGPASDTGSATGPARTTARLPEQAR